MSIGASSCGGGFALEYVTLSWNVVGIVVLAIAAVSARSVALAGFGMDLLIEIGASTVVLWELSGTGLHQQRRTLCLIGGAFGLLAVYLAVQSTFVLVAGYHPGRSVPGIIWTATTALMMFALAAGKARTGAALGNQVLSPVGRGGGRLGRDLRAGTGDRRLAVPRHPRDPVAVHQRSAEHVAAAYRRLVVP
jgi:hypothetical protein